MEPLQLAETTANALAALAAWLVWRRERAHLPVACLLTAGVVSAGAHAYLASLVPSARPIVDPSAILALHLDQARLLTWHVGVAVVVALVFGARRLARVLGLAWPALLVAGWLAPVRDVPHRALYGLAASISVGLGAWATFVRNGGAAWTTAQKTAAIVCAGELVALLTYIRNPWKGAAWTPAQAGYLVAFTACAVVQGGALWSGRSRR